MVAESYDHINDKLARYVANHISCSCCFLSQGTSIQSIRDFVLHSNLLPLHIPYPAPTHSTPCPPVTLSTYLHSVMPSHCSSNTLQPLLNQSPFCSTCPQHLLAYLQLLPDHLSPSYPSCTRSTCSTAPTYTPQSLPVISASFCLITQIVLSNCGPWECQDYYHCVMWSYDIVLYHYIG